MKAMARKREATARTERGDSRCLLILGCGYVGEALAAAWQARGGRVAGVVRDAAHAARLKRAGIEAVAAASPPDAPEALLAGTAIVVDSIPLARQGAALRATQPDWLPELARRMPRLEQAVYLSSTGVYGDAGGAWVDETTPCRPQSARGIERLRAERAWLDSGLPAEVFRLAGIYGPGRNILARLRAGDYRAVRWQPPRFSNRIHVDDIVAALLAASARPRPGRIVNLADDLPYPHADYARELAAAIGAPPPVLLSPDEATRILSPAALDFFRDDKRVSNRLLRRELLPRLTWPDFRAALARRGAAFGEADA